MILVLQTSLRADELNTVLCQSKILESENLRFSALYKLSIMISRAREIIILGLHAARLLMILVLQTFQRADELNFVQRQDNFLNWR
jgi:hypothetical protein